MRPSTRPYFFTSGSSFSTQYISYHIHTYLPNQHPNMPQPAPTQLILNQHPPSQTHATINQNSFQSLPKYSNTTDSTTWHNNLHPYPPSAYPSYTTDCNSYHLYTYVLLYSTETTLTNATTLTCTNIFFYTIHVLYCATVKYGEIY